MSGLPQNELETITWHSGKDEIRRIIRSYSGEEMGKGAGRECRISGEGASYTKPWMHKRIKHILTKTGFNV